MSKVKELHQRWLKEPGYEAEYEALAEEFQLAHTLIEARKRAGLSQAEVAERMKTSQSYVARIEGGLVQPSTAVLSRFAQATGSRLKIVFEPAPRHATAVESKAVAEKVFNKHRKLMRKLA